MPVISFIPDKYKEGFKKIALINDDEFDAIKTGLSFTSLVSSINILSKKVAEIKSLDLKDIDKIFLSAGSLVQALENKTDINEIVQNVADVSVNNKSFDVERKELFISRLSFLLNNKQIYYASKAHYLSVERENVYIGSRIVTDIRPVFDIDLEQSIQCGMIIHTMHIHYRADSEADHKDIYISLDSTDIKKLKEALERDEKKEISLQPIFKEGGIINLNE